MQPTAGSRGAAEAWGDGTAAFNDGESPLCLAYRLCRASFAGFDSGRALLAGGVRGGRGWRIASSARPRRIQDISIWPLLVAWPAGTVLGLSAAFF